MADYLNTHANVYLDTHSYDGKWLEQLNVVLNKYSEVPTAIPTNEKFTPEQQTYINMILNDNLGNIDIVNNIDAKTLLYILFDCLEKAKSNSTEAEFTQLWNVAMEQITDIANGPCPQGRTTRIFQIILAIML